MDRIVKKHFIAASPERVWSVITDFDNYASNLSGIIDAERVAGSLDGYQVGSRWRETRTMFGKSATEEMWVTDVDAPKFTEVQARNSGVQYITSFTLTASGEGTDLTWSFDADMTEASGFMKLMSKLMSGLGRKATDKMMAQDLADIQAAAERAS